MSSFITSVLLIVSLMLAWVVVMQLWKLAFPDAVINEDALAGRSSCGNCTCSGTCTIRKAQQDSKNLI